jgi:ADP-ribosylglycohydrolase
VIERLNTVTRIDLCDRIAGCLFGGAIGDAIGSQYEGKAAATNFVVPNQFYVSDDTQLTLATCDAIIEHGGVDAETIAQHFARWHRGGRISGAGASTLKALSELAAGGHWAMVGASGERAAGNGAAMRIGPLAFTLDPFDPNDRQKIRDVCRITHRHDEAYVGALAILHCIRHAVVNSGLDERLLSNLVESLPDSRVRDRLAVVKEEKLSAEDFANRFGSSGYVADSVPLAVVVSMQSTDYLQMMSRIVRIGGDADTIASMSGQIFGTANGLKSLPDEILPKIDLYSHIEKAVADLCRLATNS